VVGGPLVTLGATPLSFRRPPCPYPPDQPGVARGRNRGLGSPFKFLAPKVKISGKIFREKRFKNIN